MLGRVKIIITIMMVLISSLTVNAQFSIGIQGGLNSGRLDADNLVDGAKVSYKNGLTIGGIVNYQITDMFSLQTEPRYIQKGERVEYSVGSFDADNKIYFNYMELPIYLITEFDVSEFSPMLIGGVNLGYLLNTDVETNINGEEENFDITDDYNNIDLSIEFGVGLKYKMNNVTNLLLNVRYSHGIYDISKMDGLVITRGIQLLLGILYKL